MSYNLETFMSSTATVPLVCMLLTNAHKKWHVLVPLQPSKLDGSTIQPHSIALVHVLLYNMRLE
jgi:hypothetical protein